MEQPSENPDWKPIEMLLGDLKQAAHARKPSNMLRVKGFYKGRSKMSANQCQRLLGNYAKTLFLLKWEIIVSGTKVVLTLPGEYYIY